MDNLWLLDFPSLGLMISRRLQLGLLGLSGWTAAAISGAHTKTASEYE